MEGLIFNVTNNSYFSREKKILMLMKIFSASKKLKDHFLNCESNFDCSICQKIMTIMIIYLAYEEKNNKTLKVENLFSDYDVDELILKDDIFKIIGFETKP